MKIFEDISITDSIDSFCSTLGNELIYEKEKHTNLLLPCFNIGFYECKINISSVTKWADLCYLLFEDVWHYKIELSTYESMFPNKDAVINHNGNQFKYNINLKNENIEAISFEIEGVCYRHNSFSYGSYRIAAKSFKVILLDETNLLNNYTSNNDYKKDKYIQSFLLNNNNEKLINKIIKTP